MLAEGKSSERLLRVLRAWFGWAPGGTAGAAATLVRVLHAVHGRFGRNDSRPGRIAAADAHRRWVPRAVFDRAADGVRIARPAVSVVAAADALRHRLAESGDRGPVHRRHPARLRRCSAWWPRLACAKASVRRPGATPFVAGEAMAALWAAKWELLLPVFILGTFFAGVATLVESAPMAALYTLVVQRFIHRDLPTMQDVLRVMSDCVALVGGVLLILGGRRRADRLLHGRGRHDAADRVDPGARRIRASSSCSRSTSSCCSWAR